MADSTVSCPHCKGSVRIRAISMREMGDALLELAGQPRHNSYTTYGGLNKEELTTVYNYVMKLKNLDEVDDDGPARITTGRG